MNCVIYCRVSSDDQVRGTSLDTQETICRAFATREGWAVTNLYRDEGESAKTADRPQFQRMIRDVCAKGAGIQRVLVWKLDRFSRNADDHAIFRAQLVKAGATVVSATESMEDDPAGRLLRTVLAGISQFDNECRAERTLTAMRSLAQAGWWVHKAPLGYRSVRMDGKPGLEPDPVSGPAMADIFHGLAAGTLTAGRARAVLARYGVAISPQTLHDMLRKTIYGGRIQSTLTKQALVPTAFPALVTWDTYQAAQLTLSGRARVALPDRRGPEDFPLAGVVTCGCCGQPMRGYWAKGRSQRYGYYDCRAGCTGLRRQRLAMHGEFEALLDGITQQGQPLLGLFRMRVDYHLRAQRNSAHRVKLQADQRLVLLRTQAERLLDKLLDGTISDAQYKFRQQSIDTEVALATAEARDAHIDELDLEVTCAQAERVLGHLGQLWRDLGGDGRRRFEAALFPEGLIYNRESGFRTALHTSVFSMLHQKKFENTVMAPPSGCWSNQLRVFRSSIEHLARLMVAA